MQNETNGRIAAKGNIDSYLSFSWKRLIPFFPIFFLQGNDIAKIKCKKEPGIGRVVAKENKEN